MSSGNKTELISHILLLLPYYKGPVAKGLEHPIFQILEIFSDNSLAGTRRFT